MEQDLIVLKKGVDILIFDLNDNNDDYHILQTQSHIRTWCRIAVRPTGHASPKEDPISIAIRDGKRLRADIEERIEAGPDLLFVFGGTELAYGHVSSDVCEELIQKRITGIEFIIYSVVKSTPDLVLDKFVCGFCRKTLILTLPLITKDTMAILNQIQKVLKHALAVYHNDLVSVRAKHGETQAQPIKAPPMKSKINRDVTQRPRLSTHPMLEVGVAQKLILDFVSTTSGGEKQCLASRQAAGYILAEDTVAGDDLPPFDASIKDGYAAISSDGSGKRKVVGQRSAGGPPERCAPLKSGQCCRINTGAPVPPGADTVVPVEDTQLVRGEGGEEQEIRVLRSPVKGQDIRVKGVDIRKGSTILSAGNLLGAPELGLLASVGVVEVAVYRKPLVHIFSTGNELQEPDAHVLRPGCVRDSNRTLLSSILAEHGFPSQDRGICVDDPDLLLHALSSSLAACDVIITTGSVSMGDKDYLKQILAADLGASLHFGRVNMKPGKPCTFATVGTKLIFCLPGNPVSAMVTCHLFVLPALKAFAGSTHPLPSVLKARTTADLRLDPERPEYHRVSLHQDPAGDHLLAYSTGHQLSSKLLSCKACSGFAILPRATDKKLVEKNSLVDVVLTKSLY